MRKTINNDSKIAKVLTIHGGALQTNNGQSVVEYLCDFQNKVNAPDGTEVNIVIRGNYVAMCDCFDTAPALSCDYCGRRRDNVEALIQGQRSYICNECVEVCVEMLEEEKAKLTNADSAAPDKTNE